MGLQASESTEKEAISFVSPSTSPNIFPSSLHKHSDSIGSSGSEQLGDLPEPASSTEQYDEASIIVNELTEKKYIASLDIGTTIVKCCIFDKKLKICAEAVERVDLLHPKVGHVEMDPEQVWLMCRTVIKRAVDCVGVQNVISLGVCTQRCTFLTWETKTGEPLHNLITWKDIRADDLVQQWNTSPLMRTVRYGSRLLYWLTRNQRYLACSVLTFMNTQVILRLKWVLQQCSRVQQVLKSGEKGRLRFGTLDTWVVHKLTRGQVFATDFSNASGTAMFDPFLQCWSGFVMGLVGVPTDLLPELRTSAGDWGHCHQELFGAPLPITAVVSDQGASLAGGGGHKRGHAKVTLGTGGFLNLNTGQQPHASCKGIYPVVGWQEPNGCVVFMAEGSANDIGTVVEWGRAVGLYRGASETAALASSVPDCGGVYFVPAFQGLQAPINDSRAGCGFIGITGRTSRAHLVRALLDSLSFLVYQMMEAMLEEANFDLLDARADGGVSANVLVLQQVATLSGRSLTRFTSTELSVRGAAVLAGLGAGVFKSVAEASETLEVDRVFKPSETDRPALLHHYHTWQAAVGRFTRWQDKPVHDTAAADVAEEGLTNQGADQEASEGERPRL